MTSKCNMSTQKAGQPCIMVKGMVYGKHRKTLGKEKLTADTTMWTTNYETKKKVI